MRAGVLIVVLAALAGCAEPAPPAPAYARLTPAQRERAAEAVQACRGDVQAYCADVPRGGGRILQCLRDHRGQVSDGCQAALTSAH